MGEVVRTVGAKTFVFQDGVWIDTTYDADTMETTKVPSPATSTSSCWPNTPSWGRPSPSASR